MCGYRLIGLRDEVFGFRVFEHVVAQRIPGICRDYKRTMGSLSKVL